MNLAALQKVELVGGESWLTHNFGSMVIGLAAIFAAGLAAYISVRNHKQQLSHDRAIRDRDTIRKTIDEAVRNMSGFILEGVTFAAKIRALERARNDLEESDQEEEKALPNQQKQLSHAEKVVTEALSPIYAATNTMHADTILLAIRLGKKSSISESHAETRETLKAWFVSLSKGRVKNRDEGEREASEQALKTVSQARTTFETACYEWMNDKP